MLLSTCRSARGGVTSGRQTIDRRVGEGALVTSRTEPPRRSRRAVPEVDDPFHRVLVEDIASDVYYVDRDGTGRKCVCVATPPPGLVG